MNALWIVALNPVVLVEKLAGIGVAAPRLSGGLFVVWGLVTLWI